MSKAKAKRSGEVEEGLMYPVVMVVKARSVCNLRKTQGLVDRVRNKYPSLPG